PQNNAAPRKRSANGNVGKSSRSMRRETAFRRNRTAPEHFHRFPGILSSCRVWAGLIRILSRDDVHMRRTATARRGGQPQNNAAPLKRSASSKAAVLNSDAEKVTTVTGGKSA